MVYRNEICSWFAEDRKWRLTPEYSILDLVLHEFNGYMFPRYMFNALQMFQCEDMYYTRT